MPVFSGCLIDCLRHMVADEGKAVVIPTEAVVSIVLMIDLIDYLFIV